MDGNFLDFFIYLVTNIHKDMNALFIVSFLVIGSFFTIRALLVNSDIILGIMGNIVLIFFVMFVLFLLYVFIGVPFIESQ
tara:strand:- start:138 stop:377 length:240 start_codon:yes stop_codon:yes gene_type:complete